MTFTRNYLPAFFLDDSKDSSKVELIEVLDKISKKQIALLILEKKYENKINNQEIKIIYKLLTEHQNKQTFGGEFEAVYYGRENIVSFAPLPIFLDLPGLEGQRIGTYIMNEIILWAKQWPTANVYPINLQVHEAYKENKDIRNRFYERFGFELMYKSEEKLVGESKNIKVKDLKNVESWKENIKIHNLQDFIYKTYQANLGYKRTLIELKKENNYLDLIINKIKKSPIKYAIFEKYYRVLIIFSLIFIAVYFTYLKYFKS